MFRLVAITVLSVTANAQENTPIAQAAKNPYALGRYIDSHTHVDWSALWAALRIADPPRTPECDATIPCEVEVITVPNPSQVILLIHSFPDDIYLRFLESASGWAYGGHHSVLLKNVARRHETSKVNGKPMLRVSGQGASGSGVGSEVEHWLDLSRPDLKSVFGVTVAGHESRMGVGIGRHIQASALPEYTENVIHVSLYVRFTLQVEDQEIDVGSADITATYARTSKGAFQWVSAKPSISKNDFEKLANIDLNNEATNEQLLVYAMPRLKEIANGSDRKAQARLRVVLNYCKNTPEVLELKALLSKAR